MGWSGGTEIFDLVADELMILHIKDYRPISLLEVVNPLYPLNKKLEDMDWDNQNESKYYDHPVIGRILGNKFEDEEE